MVIRIALLEDPVPVLDIAEVAHGLHEGTESRRLLSVSDRRTEIGDAPHLARLLSSDGERPGEEATCKRRHESPASKRIAERLASDRVGHRPPYGDRWI